MSYLCIYSSFVYCICNMWVSTHPHDSPCACCAKLPKGPPAICVKSKVPSLFCFITCWRMNNKIAFVKVVLYMAMYINIFLLGPLSESSEGFLAQRHQPFKPPAVPGCLGHGGEAQAGIQLAATRLDDLHQLLCQFLYEDQGTCRRGGEPGE